MNEVRKRKKVDCNRSGEWEAAGSWQGRIGAYLARPVGTRGRVSGKPNHLGKEDERQRRRLTKSR